MSLCVPRDKVLLSSALFQDSDGDVSKTTPRLESSRVPLGTIPETTSERASSHDFPYLVNRPSWFGLTCVRFILLSVGFVYNVGSMPSIVGGFSPLGLASKGGGNMGFGKSMGEAQKDKEGTLPGSKPKIGF